MCGNALKLSLSTSSNIENSIVSPQADVRQLESSRHRTPDFVAQLSEAKHNDVRFFQKNSTAYSQGSEQMKRSARKLPTISRERGAAAGSHRNQDLHGKNVENQPLQKSKERRPISPERLGSTGEENSAKRSKHQHESRVLTERIN